QPDLTLDMPMPRFAFYVLGAGADSAEFMANEERTLKLSTHVLPTLAYEADLSIPAVALGDDDGPLFTLRNTHPAPVARELEQWGQFYTAKNGTLYRGIWEWEGVAVEHQHPGDAGRVYSHPFYGELATHLGDCWLQMFGARDAEIVQRFF